MKRPLARDGRPYDNRGVPNAVAVYLGVYKTLYPTPPGFLSAGTLSSPTPVFHPQAWCLPTTSNLHYSHETYLLRHVCQNRHLLLCPCYLRRCRPHPQGPTYAPPTPHYFLPLTQTTAGTAAAHPPRGLRTAAIKGVAHAVAGVFHHITGN